MNVAAILAEFPKLRVLVVGDVCLDRWCQYDPKLADPSRETDIPRIGVVATEVTPGAAGTVASNVAALGAKAAVLGVIGADGFGFELKGALAARGIDGSQLVESSSVATFTYTKLINIQTGQEDLPRVDFVNAKPLAEELEAELVRRLEAIAPNFDVILVSDQAETNAGGVVTGPVREALARIASARSVWVWADSRMRPELFRGVVMKINRFEAEAACQRTGCADFEALRKIMQAPILVVTRGGLGAQVFEGDIPSFVKANPVENPVDICGAGDSFSAGAALTLATKRGAITAARFGNLVASITIMKKGTGTASPEEVVAAAKTQA
jgi:rfaE bifunctional protein kinase chain/domain